MVVCFVECRVKQGTLVCFYLNACWVFFLFDIFIHSSSSFFFCMKEMLFKCIIYYFFRRSCFILMVAILLILMMACKMPKIEEVTIS